jgi:hypothetical protein
MASELGQRALLVYSDVSKWHKRKSDMQKMVKIAFSGRAFKGLQAFFYLCCFQKERVLERNTT